MPERIQLSRAKGFRLQEASVALNGLSAAKVDRSTPYGNPWPVGEPGPLDRIAPDAEGATGLFCAMLGDPEMREAAGYPSDLSPLTGKNLACWCAGPHCHVFPLLRAANP